MAEVVVPGWVVYIVIGVVGTWLLFLTKISQDNRERILLHNSAISDIKTDLEEEVKAMRQDLRDFREEMKKDYDKVNSKLDLFLQREYIEMKRQKS